MSTNIQLEGDFFRVEINFQSKSEVEVTAIRKNILGTPSFRTPFWIMNKEFAKT